MHLQVFRYHQFIHLQVYFSASSLSVSFFGVACFDFDHLQVEEYAA
jgi:hypothetical protein